MRTPLEHWQSLHCSNLFCPGPATEPVTGDRRRGSKNRRRINGVVVTFVVWPGATLRSVHVRSDDLSYYSSFLLLVAMASNLFAMAST